MSFFDKILSKRRKSQPPPAQPNAALPQHAPPKPSPTLSPTQNVRSPLQISDLDHSWDSSSDSDEPAPAVKQRSSLPPHFSLSPSAFNAPNQAPANNQRARAPPPPASPAAPPPPLQNPFNVATVQCPICGSSLNGMNEYAANMHVEECLNGGPSQPQAPAALAFPAQHAPPEPDTFGLTVQCPYPSCDGRFFDLRDFPGHVIKNHQAGPQGFACPICSLLSDATYVPNSSTNLRSHIASQHADLVAISAARGFGGPPAPAPVSPQPPKPISEAQQNIVRKSSHLGFLPPADAMAPPPAKSAATYILETLRGSLLDEECTICFAEFEAGQLVARMACLCVYHKHCIECTVDGWFERKGKPGCPLHDDR